MSTRADAWGEEWYYPDPVFRSVLDGSAGTVTCVDGPPSLIGCDVLRPYGLRVCAYPHRDGVCGLAVGHVTPHLLCSQELVDQRGRTPIVFGEQP